MEEMSNWNTCSKSCWASWTKMENVCLWTRINRLHVVTISQKAVRPGCSIFFQNMNWSDQVQELANGKTSVGNQECWRVMSDVSYKAGSSCERFASLRTLYCLFELPPSELSLHPFHHLSESRHIKRGHGYSTIVLNYTEVEQPVSARSPLRQHRGWSQWTHILFIPCVQSKT